MKIIRLTRIPRCTFCLFKNPLKHYYRKEYWPTTREFQAINAYCSQKQQFRHEDGPLGRAAGVGAGHGDQHLKPLILRDIAEAIDMHESTVSRVTANKYIATPRGNYELKYFFTSAISGAAGGESHSAEAVRHRIKNLIDDEKPKEVLSDDKIVEVLKLEGIDIARRTIAKYRKAMHIPSSIQRRREKTAGL